MSFICVLQRVRIPYRKTSFSFPRQLPIHRTLDAWNPILHIIYLRLLYYGHSENSTHFCTARRKSIGECEPRHILTCAEALAIIYCSDTLCRVGADVPADREAADGIKEPSLYALVVPVPVYDIFLLPFLAAHRTHIVRSIPACPMSPSSRRL